MKNFFKPQLKSFYFTMVFVALLNALLSSLQACAHRNKGNNQDEKSSLFEAKPQKVSEAAPQAIEEWLTDLVSADQLPFVPHTGNGNMQNYLAMNLPFEPAQALKKAIEKKLNLRLKDRGEAHITVITPVEYDQVLRSFVKIADINDIALAQHIQQARVEPVCIGSFKKTASAAQQVFFVVVKSAELLALRQAVKDLFEERGGQRGAFDPTDFQPHVTLGFTDRDLHKADGAVKTEAACIDNPL